MKVEVRTRQEIGARHYTRYSLVVDGIVVREQLHGFSPDQIADACNPKSYAMKPFVILRKHKPGPKRYQPDDMEDAA